jgi:hypothetical protein
MIKFLATVAGAGALLAFTLTTAGQSYARPPSGAAPHPQPVSAPGKPHPAPAAHNKVPYQHRMENQQDRLNRAYSKGKISKAQYNHDSHKLHSIQVSERKDLKSGGKLTSQERDQLKNKMTHSGNRIHNDKVNGPPH